MRVTERAVSLQRYRHEAHWPTMTLSSNMNVKIDLAGDWQQTVGGNTTAGISTRGNTVTLTKTFLDFREVFEEWLLHTIAHAWVQLPYYDLCAAKAA